jgi:membrane protein implicated in regulation of membrane protease activity
VVLAAVETFVPGAVAMWFAVSAGIVGLLLLVVPLPWQIQWVLFAVLGVVALLIYRNYFRSQPDSSAQPNLNQRGLQYVGHELTLMEPITQGYGKVRVGDGVWKVMGKDLPAGAKVRVVGADGTVLKVDPV